MYLIDYPIIAFLNGFAARSGRLDFFIELISSNYLLKASLIMALVLWVWFQEDERSANRRASLLLGLSASLIAVLFARILSFTVPFRERPLRNPDLHFVLPYSVNPDAILGWNSFPSDNAALWFGVAACLFLVSRRAGILAFCNVILTVGLARIYLGYHYPTDILAGALLGVGTVSLIRLPALKQLVVRMPMRWLKHHPQSFYSVFFLLLFLTFTTFEPLYPLAHQAIKACRTEFPNFCGKPVRLVNPNPPQPPASPQARLGV